MFNLCLVFFFDNLVVWQGVQICVYQRESSSDKDVSGQHAQMLTQYIYIYVYARARNSARVCE